MYVDIRESAALCQLQQTVQMRIVAVDAAVRQESEQMQRGTLRFAVFHSLHERRILKESPILDLLRDSGKLLVDDPPRAHV